MVNLTKEQLKSIREQLYKQLEELPDEQKLEASKFIDSMNDEQLEKFLIERGMIQTPEQHNTKKSKEDPKINSENPECIYCLISQHKVDSLPIYEDKNHIAVLEINPMSKAHTILIPKKHLTQTKNLPARSFSLANKIGKHIIKKLKKENAESFEVSSSAQLGHAIINIIPSYKGESITYERKKQTKEELQKTAMKIGELIKPVKKPKTSKKQVRTQSRESLIQLPRRIP